MKKHFISLQELNGSISSICRNILLSGWKPDYIVGICRGGLVPAVMVSHYLNIPMHTIEISLRDSVDCESNLWMAEDAFGHNNDIQKNILVIDDINDSGATINWLIKDWQSSCLPQDSRWKHVWNQNVKFAVIVDNLSSKCQIKMDYVGIEINKAVDNVWIDFPWENWWCK